MTFETKVKWRMSCPGGSEPTLSCRSLVTPSMGPRIGYENQWLQRQFSYTYAPIGEENCPQKWGPPSTKSHTIFIYYYFVKTTFWTQGTSKRIIILKSQFQFFGDHN